MRSAARRRNRPSCFEGMTVVVAGGRPGVVIETAMDPIPAAGGGSPSETDTKSPLAKRTAATWYVRPPARTVRTA